MVKFVLNIPHQKKKKGQAHSLAIIHLAICPNHSVAVV